MNDDELDEVADGLSRRKAAKAKARSLQRKALNALLKDADVRGLDVVDLGAYPKTNYDLAGWREYIIGVRVTIPPGNHKPYRWAPGDAPNQTQLQRIYLSGSSWMWPYAVSQLIDTFVTNEERDDEAFLRKRRKGKS
jgi:hypothetical protein